MLDHIAHIITEFLKHNNNPLGFVLLAGSALLEYVFPPFPGDTVTLFGAILITRFHWNLLLTFAALMIGSGVGAMLDYGFGVWLQRRYYHRQPSTSSRIANIFKNLEGVKRAFERHGDSFIIFNRFIPALRAFIFVGAGAFGLRWWRVLLFSLLSAALWNALILAAGYSVGQNWELLLLVFKQYAIILWILLGIVVIILIFRWWRRRSKVTP